MTFLTPLALFGLVAAAIPILLHIFNLRKLKTIEFSTLKFLKELQKTKIHRLKLRQLLLLFLRTLLIVLIVIAFSRPTLKGSIPGGLAERARTTAVILFDDSQSMTASDELGELLLQAKNNAISILNFMKDGDEVFLVKLSDVTVDNHTESIPGQRNFSAVHSIINDIKPSYMHRSIEDGLRYCSRLLTSSKNFNKEIYIISDFQSGSLESKLELPPGISFPPAAQLFLVPLGKHEVQNIAIESIEIPGAIFEIGKPFNVKVKLKNYGELSVQNHLTSVYQEGERTAQKGTDIPSGQSAEIEFTLVPKHTGFLQGFIELEDDDLEFDNKRYFTVFIPEQLRVLLVGSMSDLSYIKLALKTRLSDSTANVTIKEVNWNRFSPMLLSETDVLVITNPPELAESQSAALRSYLQSGKGALIFPGTASTISVFNKTISAVLGFTESATIENLPGTQGSVNSYIEFDKADLRHPLFSGMFEEKDTRSAGHVNTQRVLESPKIKTAFRFLTTPRSRVIVTLSDGSPFLFEEAVGKGRVLIFCIPANTEWSDLPMKGIFVPLVHRSLAYAAQEPAAERSLSVGEGKKIDSRNSASSVLIVKKPNGMEIMINEQSALKGRFSNTDIPGFYSVTAGNRICDGFAVNTDPDESITFQSNHTQIEKTLNRFGIENKSIHTIDQQQQTGKIIGEARFGSEIWKIFLIAALITALAEMLVARDTKKTQASLTTYKE